MSPRRRLLATALGMLWPSAALAQGTDFDIASTACTSFEWDGGAPPGSIRIPVVIGSDTLWYQLDTGSNASISYGSRAQRWGWDSTSMFVRVQDLRVGGTVIPAAQLYVMHTFEPAPGGTAGTIGLDVLVNHVVILDHPGQRLCVLPRADAPSWVWTDVDWSPAVLRNGKYFVQFQLNGRPLEDLFFDTGAGSYVLNVDAALWRDLTGRSGAEHATVKDTGQAFGKRIPHAGAPVRGVLQVGGTRLDSVIAFYRPDEPNHFGSMPFTANGMVGNTALLRHVVVLDLGVGPRYAGSGIGPGFGVLRKKINGYNKGARPGVERVRERR